MAGRAEEGINAAVSTVGAAALLGGLVDLYVPDDESVEVETLGLCVAFSILQEAEKEAGALLWPAALGDAPGLGLSTPTNATVEATEGNALLLLTNVVQKGLGLAQLHTLENRSCLPGVLKVHAQVVSACLARLGLVMRLEGISHGRG